jgi:hypothetical protein
MAYDKGTAQGITRLAVGIYAVESFRDELKTYTVDLHANRCTCPHFTNRLNASSDDLSCKHIAAARAERFRSLTEKARTLPAPELEALLPKYERSGDLEIAVAIRSELHARTEHAAQQDTLRALFA